MTSGVISVPLIMTPPVGSALVSSTSSRCRECRPGRPGTRPCAVELLRLVDLEREADRLEDIARQVHGVGIRHDHLGERVELELVAEAKPAVRSR